MLIFIENTPRAYDWGSREALPELLGLTPTGEPQAELWLGAHPGDPATVAKASSKGSTLIELIESDPERYGVDGGQLPFLLKVLAIGRPLSLQVHPDFQQAQRGFAAEEAAGIARDARERNYGDPNHKPELLVALSEVRALSGFRPLSEVRADLLALAEVAPAGAGRDALRATAHRCSVIEVDEQATRKALMEWALSDDAEAQAARDAVFEVVDRLAPAPPDASGAGGNIGAGDDGGDVVDPLRIASLREIAASYPGDPGILVSLLLNLVRLAPGEAIFLGARQLHAYLSGIGVEVMAASDNVLRAGLTSKHVDVAELMRVVNFEVLTDARLASQRVARGLREWSPPVNDFRLMLARVSESANSQPGESAPHGDARDRAESVLIDARYPLVLIVTSGRVRVSRRNSELNEVASARRGQSLYVSAGGSIELSGAGDAFVATVGEGWAPPEVSPGVSPGAVPGESQ